MRGTTTFATLPGMHSGRHTIVIELDDAEGPPQGRISVDGAGEQAFHGWIDLTARLEALRQGSAEADAGVERGLDDVGDRVQEHDEERAVDRDRHDRAKVQLVERMGGVLPDAL
jgi:hypothetical protein